MKEVSVLVGCQLLVRGLAVSQGNILIYDMGTINFADPQFVKYLIETYG